MTEKGERHKAKGFSYLSSAFGSNYISEEEYNIINKQVNEVRAMLISFIKFLRN